MFKNRDIVWLVYFGNKGIAGLYTNRITCALSKGGILFKSFVSFGYHFDDSFRVFFPITDRFTIRIDSLRKMIRVIELFCAYLLILILAICYRPKSVNVSLTSGTFIDVLFLRSIKLFTRSRIIVTCHDIIPFAESDSSEKHIKNIFSIAFSIADFVLCHNEYSIRALFKIYAIHSDKVLFHRFPMMDCSKIYGEISSELVYDFAFVGHLRRNKGVDLLLDSWKLFSMKEPKARLFIGGKLPKESCYLENFDQCSLNATIKLDYLSDFELYDVLRSTRVVILPYRYGTNSGILSHALSAGCVIIYSCIESFLTMDYLDHRGAFQPLSVDGLLVKMEEYYKSGEFVFDLLKYEDLFEKEVVGVYTF